MSASTSMPWAPAPADGFKVSSHAANAAEAVLLEDFNDLRIFLNGFNDTRVFCNLCHYFYSSLSIRIRTVLKELPDCIYYIILFSFVRGNTFFLQELAVGQEAAEGQAVVRRFGVM